MALIVVFDEGASPEVILDVDRSGNEGLFLGRTDVLINPDLSGVVDVPRKYLKHLAGAVVPMDTAEREAVNAAEVATASEAERVSARLEVDSRLLRAIVAHFHIRVNQNADPADQMTAAQAKVDILARIDAG